MHALFLVWARVLRSSSVFGGLPQLELAWLRCFCFCCAFALLGFSVEFYAVPCCSVVVFPSLFCRRFWAAAEFSAGSGAHPKFIALGIAAYFAFVSLSLSFAFHATAFYLAAVFLSTSDVLCDPQHRRKCLCRKKDSFAFCSSYLFFFVFFLAHLCCRNNCINDTHTHTLTQALTYTHTCSKNYYACHLKFCRFC